MSTAISAWGAADGASPRHNGKGSVAATPCLPNVVNRTAPELFPVMSLVKKRFTPRETGSVAAFALNAMFLYKILKLLHILWLTN